MIGNHFILTLRDELTGETLTRRIDKGWGMIAAGDGDVLGTPEQQRRGIERWIDQAGNAQHETVLELVSWELEKIG